MAEEKKADISAYAPTKKPDGAKNFNALCKDPTYPCRLCDRTEKPMECVRLKECVRYQKWFTEEWRRIQRAFRVEPKKKIF